MENLTDYADNYLSEIEKELVGIFYANEAMREAVKKALLVRLYYHGTIRKDEKADPHINTALALANHGELTDEQVGQRVRIMRTAIDIIERAFNTMSRFRPEEEKGRTENSSR